MQWGCNRTSMQSSASLADKHGMSTRTWRTLWGVWQSQQTGEVHMQCGTVFICSAGQFALTRRRRISDPYVKECWDEEEDSNWSIEAEVIILRDGDRLRLISWWEYRVEFRSVQDDVVSNDGIPSCWWSFLAGAQVDVKVMSELRLYWMQTLTYFCLRVCLHEMIMSWVNLLF